MVAGRFEEWCGQASAAERSAAAGELAAIFLRGPREDRLPAADLLSRLALDPSPRVREAVAQPLAASRETPPALVRLFLDDIDRIAVLFAARSPVPTTAGLVDLAAVGSPAIRVALARRKPVCARLSAALVEIGEAVVCRELLLNHEAEVPAATLRRIIDCAGQEAGISELMLARPNLPADIRDRLALAVAARLTAMPLVRGALNGAAERVVAEACENATMTIARRAPAAELGRFGAHLRESGRLSTAFLVNAACRGELDLFAASLAELSGLPYARVRQVIVDAKEGPFEALLEKAEVPRAAASLLLLAIRSWKQAVRRGLDPQDSGVAGRVIERLATELSERGDEALGAIVARTLSLSARRTADERRIELRQAA